ncbi:iron-sulfur assembly protein 1 [Diplogelasinospora grovesii]|uniref:Iron-sulfur assembly protein 1 n=1 Tax=Diplogelasinospora grovesii TaxID=303347 RepID=A0AAN6N1R8_9PEZI|nr:iron-sulfur assembly protein 1 [Diplogelasinospora grovesii]
MNAPTLLSRRTFSVCQSCRRSLLLQQRQRNIVRQFSATPAPLVATSFQSYTLPTHPPTTPSRNAAAPDTSITRPVDGPLPRVHETRPPKHQTPTPTPTQTQTSSVGEGNKVSIPEQQAQKSKPAFAQTPETAKAAAAAGTGAETKAAPKPRSKLRTPRKAAMKLTPAAVEQLRALLDQPDPKLIKVGVKNRGCSGLAYHLEYVDKAGAFDETVEQDGVKVLIDSKALFSIIGTEMDWVEDKLNQRFVFRNPNIKEQCGCGESFMV